MTVPLGLSPAEVPSASVTSGILSLEFWSEILTSPENHDRLGISGGDFEGHVLKENREVKVRQT